MNDISIDSIRSRLASIVESSSDAIISKTLDGVITSWNQAAQRLFGYSEAEAIGQSITIIIPPDLRDQEAQIIERLRRGERIDHSETRRMTRDGRLLDVSLTISPLRDATGAIVGASKILRDITDIRSEQARAETALRESEERFRLLANTAPVLIWMSDVSKGCSFVNQAWLDLIGQPLAAVLGSGWTAHMHDEDRAACYDVYARAFDRREAFQIEFRLRRHDGEWRWIVSSGVPMFHADGSFAGYMGSALDVTERKRAAEALACVPRRLIDAQEEERSRIARELHDDYSQRLAMVVFNLDECMGAAAELSSGFRQQLKAARDEVMSLAKDVQALSYSLHPARVELLGISSAAAALCRDISRQRGVSIIFSAERVFEDVPRRVAVCLYRVLQEALQNAVKHSGAATIAVSLGGNADEIEMTIRDHGEGFDVAGTQGRGLGLISMRERIKAVHGRLVILSEPHHGTTISVSVPLLQECLR